MTTIVVIIIIASVIISVTVSGNKLIDMTITAKDENVKGIATETMNLKNLLAMEMKFILVIGKLLAQ